MTQHLIQPRPAPAPALAWANAALIAQLTELPVDTLLARVATQRVDRGDDPGPSRVGGRALRCAARGRRPSRAGCVAGLDGRAGRARGRLRGMTPRIRSQAALPMGLPLRRPGIQHAGQSTVVAQSITMRPTPCPDRRSPRHERCRRDQPGRPGPLGVRRRRGQRLSREAANREHQAPDRNTMAGDGERRYRGPAAT